MSFNSEFDCINAVASQSQASQDPSSSSLDFRVNLSLAERVRGLFKAHGLQSEITYQADASLITVSRAMLDRWLDSQRAFAAPLSLDVPTLIKVVSNQQLNAAERQQVQVALRALDAKAFDNIAAVAKRSDLDQVEALCQCGIKQCALHPEEIQLCEKVAANVFKAKQAHTEHLQQLYAKVADKNCPKSEVIALLEKGVNVNATNDSEMTLLKAATKSGNVEAIEALIAYGANVNQVHGDRMDSALHVAVSHQQIEALKVLLNHKPNVLLADNNGNTALHYAAGLDFPDAIELLVLHKADIHQQSHLGSPLHLAAAFGACGAIETLLKLRSSIDSVNSEGDTPLHLAALYRREDKDGTHLKALKSLISHGANVALTNKDGKTALQIALQNEKWGAITSLLEADSSVNPSIRQIWTLMSAGKSDLPDYETMKDADVVRQFFDQIYSLKECPDNVQAAFKEIKEQLLDSKEKKRKNTTALFAELIQQNPNVEKMKTLIKRGINPAATTYYSGIERTLLMLVVSKGFNDLIPLLIAAGATVNQQNSDGTTPLIVACNKIDSKVVAQLLDLGADPNLESQSGETPLIAAAATGDPASVALLLDRGADINKTTKAGTALHLAARLADDNENHMKIFEHLLEKGALITPVNRLGETVLHEAVRSFKAVKTLMEKGGDINQAASQGETPLDYIVKSDANNIAATIRYLVEKGHAEKMARSILQKGGQAVNLETILSLVPNLQIQPQVRDIDFRSLNVYINDILNLAGRKEEAMGLLEQFVAASLAEYGQEMGEQPFDFIRDNQHIIVMAQGHSDLRVPFRDFFQLWATLHGNPSMMLDALIPPPLSPLPAFAPILEVPGTYFLEVAKDVIVEQPQIVLQSLCDKFHEQVHNRLEIKMTGPGEAGQDVGGPGRQFVSTLFSALSNQLQFAKLDNGLVKPAILENKEGNFPPLTKEEKETYRNIGKLIMFCLNAEVPYPIGNLLDQSVFVALTKLPPDDLQHEFDSLDFNDAEVFGKMLQVYKGMHRLNENDAKTIASLEKCLNPQNEEDWKAAEQIALLDEDFEKGTWTETAARQAAIQAAVKKYVLETKLKPELSPLFEIAKGMKTAPFTEPNDFTQIQQLAPAKFSRQLQGIVTKKEIQNKLRFEYVSAEKMNDLKKWFENWIEQAPLSKIEDFIFALSGSTAIGEGAVIKIQEEGNFFFHTCYNTFGIKSSAINSEEDLKKHLTWTLEHVKAQGGFDMA